MVPLRYSVFPPPPHPHPSSSFLVNYDELFYLPNRRTFWLKPPKIHHYNEIGDYGASINKYNQDPMKQILQDLKNPLDNQMGGQQSNNNVMMMNSNQMSFTQMLADPEFRYILPIFLVVFLACFAVPLTGYVFTGIMTDNFSYLNDDLLMEQLSYVKSTTIEKISDFLSTIKANIFTKRTLVNTSHR